MLDAKRRLVEMDRDESATKVYHIRFLSDFRQYVSGMRIVLVMTYG